MKAGLSLYMKASSWGRALSRGRLGRFRAVRALKAWVERALAGGRYTTVEVSGHSMRVRCDGVSLSSCLAYARGEFEATMTKLFDSALEPGHTVLDVGASVGYYTLIAARAVGPSGKVYSFEPASEDVELLLDNVTRNGYQNVVVLPSAVSDRDGPATFFIAPGHTGFHTFYPDKDAQDSWRPVDVECVTVDHFLKGSSVDVIKLDVEGSEPLALKGMERTVRASKNLTMLVELNPAALDRAGFGPEQLLEQLTHLDMDVKIIDEDNGSLLDPDAIALRERSGAPVDYAWNLYCVKL